jgi:uncharacterized protein
MAERRPDRVLSGAHAEFWRHCGDGELWLQQCQVCGLWQWPSVADERCERGDGPVAWHRVSGRGRVVGWCSFERAYYPELSVPYGTLLVELDEGVLFIANPLGFPAGDDAVGLTVRVAFLDATDEAGDFRLPVFERDFNAGVDETG